MDNHFRAKQVNEREETNPGEEITAGSNGLLEAENIHDTFCRRPE